ncbi:hypothetical protein ACJMK2_043696 [Sinanodonta woodiana]|uniref:Uncharacterized protein n=1 Tax=Sinanodonta woodiana TaxID=1069815 RepID=A0ABD3VXR5_SINWO
MADNFQILTGLIMGLQTKFETFYKKQEDIEKRHNKYMKKIEKKMEEMAQLISQDIKENIEDLQQTVDLVSTKVMNMSKTINKLKTPCNSVAMSDSDNNSFMTLRKRNRNPRLPKSPRPTGHERGNSQQARNQINFQAPNNICSDENPSSSDSDPEKVVHTNSITGNINLFGLVETVKTNIPTLNPRQIQDSPVQDVSLLGPQSRPSPTVSIVVRSIQDEGGAKISGLPQEKDFMHLMEELGLERNSHTIAAVCKAGEGVRSNIKITGMNTVCIFDISTSMSGEPVTQLKQFMDNFIQGVEDAAVQHTLEEKIAVITCGETTTIVKHFTNDYQQVRQVTDALQVVGRTPLMTALVLAFCYIELHGEVLDLNGHLIYPRIILISDGLATNDNTFSGQDNVTPGHDGIQVQKRLFLLGKTFRERRYPVYCIGVGQFNQPALDGLAKVTGGQLFSHTDGRTVGKYYWHQTMAGRVFSRGYEIIQSGGRVDINQLLDDLAAEQHFTQEDKAMIKSIIERESQNTSTVEEPALAEAYVPTDDHASSIPPSIPQSLPTSNTSAPVGGDWTVTVQINDYPLDEIASLPPLGSRVTRGPHWKWGDQDGNGSGTVVRHVDKGKVTIYWDNGNISDYRYGLNGTIYDLTKDPNYRQVAPGQIEVGCFVARGPEWSRGDEDGGEGTLGMVLRKLPDWKVMVRWPCRVIETYNFGENNKFELAVVTQPRDSSHSESTNLGAHISSSKSTPLGIAHGLKPVLVEDEAAEIPIWQWEDRDRGWRIFNKQSITKIETVYSKNSKANVMARVKNKNVKIFLELEQYEFPHNSQRGKIRRRMVPPQEERDLLSLEDTYEL